MVDVVTFWNGIQTPLLDGAAGIPAYVRGLVAGVVPVAFMASLLLGVLSRWFGRNTSL